MPELESALLDGMGSRTIERIRALVSKYRKIVEQHDANAAHKFDDIYRASLHAVKPETGELDIADLQRELIDRVAKQLNTDPADLLRTAIPTPKRKREDPDTPNSAEPQLTKPNPISSLAQPSDTQQTETSAAEPTSVDSDKDLSPDCRLVACRTKGESISQTLALDYGLLVGIYYAIPEVGLGYGIENPDHSELITGDTEKDLDAVVVLLELHAIFWSLREIEISSGRLHRNDALLKSVSKNATPSDIASSKTLRAIPQDRLTWRLHELRLQSAIAQSQDKMSTERSLVERLDGIRFQADQYAISLTSHA